MLSDSNKSQSQSFREDAFKNQCIILQGVEEYLLFMKKKKKLAENYCFNLSYQIVCRMF